MSQTPADPWSSLTDDLVMDRAATGFRDGSTDALLAPIEMLRRVAVSLNLYREEAKAAGHKLEILTRWLVGLTFVLVVLTIAVVWLTATLPNG